jgi:hypothetical protein
VDAEYLFGLEIVVVHENGAVYTGVVTTAVYGEETGDTAIQINGQGPSASEYLIPAYYYTISGFTYDHVVFDYVNMRWRSTYDYNFQQFCNLGQTLVGWGMNNVIKSDYWLIIIGQRTVQMVRCSVRALKSECFAALDLV